MARRDHAGRERGSHGPTARCKRGLPELKIRLDACVGDLSLVNTRSRITLPGSAFPVTNPFASVCSSVRSSCGVCYLGIRLIPLSCNLLVEVEIGCCRTGDHSRTTAEGEVLECPLNKHQHPALKLDDVHQVNERPNEPRRQPRELESKCIRNRSGASNHGEVSLVEVFEGWQLLSRFDSFYDGLRRIDASLHRDLGKTGQRFSRAIERQREIPNHEYVSEARQSQAGFNLDPAALV